MCAQRLKKLSCVHLVPHGGGACVIHGSSVDCVGEPSEAERALVVERLARQTAEVAQQTVGTWPAGVDAEEIGTLPMFSGDIDLSEQSDSVPWSQWSLTGLLRKVQSDDDLDAAASGKERG